MKIPEAAVTYLPSPSTARLKIPPHMTEVQSPMRTRQKALMGTSAKPKERPEVEDWKTGMEMGMEVGRKMARAVRMSAAAEAVVSIALGETLAAMAAPMKRPTSMRNQ